MSILGISLIIIVMGVILAPLGIFATQMGLFKSLKKDKTDVQQISENMQNQMMTVMLGLLMRSPQPVNQPNSHPQSAATESTQSQEFVEYAANPNQDFYNTQMQAMIQPAATLANANSKDKRNSSSPTKNNGFLVGLLTGVSIFLFLTLVTVLLI